MKRALLLVAAAFPLCAAGPLQTSGNAALALAAIVGGYSPLLPSGQKALLATLFNGTIPASAAHAANIAVKAISITCSAGDVDITARTCTLTFDPHTITLHGRKAHELYATMIESQVPSEGAAGTIYESLKDLSCTVSPSEVAQRAGGGATCGFTPGP
jgi:hypothetical protein